MKDKKILGRIPLAGVIMGSVSDWETMKEACGVLEELDVVFEKLVVSAHRTPEWMSAYATQAEERGLQIILLEPVAQHIFREWLLRKLCFLSCTGIK